MDLFHKYPCFRSVFVGIALILLPTSLLAKERLSPMGEDRKQVTEWNRFADSLRTLHKAMLNNTSVRTEEEVGGYGGTTGGDFYTEIRYYDKKTGLLISKVQWELERPDVIHNIEIFIHDDEGLLMRDYYAGFLPHHRNAPLRTMVNFYGDHANLKSFRQFDASGERIYEQCSGKHFGNDVDISLEDNEWEFPSDEGKQISTTEAYIACFGDVPKKVGKYLDPLVDMPASAQADARTSDVVDAYEVVNARIEGLTKNIALDLNVAHSYIQRAEEYFKQREFALADNDLTKALELDSNLDSAWYWRGMVRGRQGRHAEGIADLSVFLKRHPDSSLAYTKRGVRYIWKGELDNAERDLRRAIELNPVNAEAHDDLGVIMAQKKQLDQAIEHFTTTIKLDPTYQKGHHNRATALFLQGNDDEALYSVNQSLHLSPDNRSSLLLKSEILASLGRNSEAAAIRNNAEFLQEGGWEEQFTVKRSN